jgi:hypothetical protein
VIFHRRTITMTIRLQLALQAMLLLFRAHGGTRDNRARDVTVSAERAGRYHRGAA